MKVDIYKPYTLRNKKAINTLQKRLLALTCSRKVAVTA